jgi:hypothetical protein
MEDFTAIQGQAVNSLKQMGWTEREARSIVAGQEAGSYRAEAVSRAAGRAAGLTVRQEAAWRRARTWGGPTADRRAQGTRSDPPQHCRPCSMRTKSIFSPPTCERR